MGTSYGSIFKSTMLFGVVQVLKAIMSVVKNKIAAVLIGPEGIGILGIFNSAIRVIQTGAGLGVSQSAVRDVSEAAGSGDSGIDSTGVSTVDSAIDSGIIGSIGCS